MGQDHSVNPAHQPNKAAPSMAASAVRIIAYVICVVIARYLVMGIIAVGSGGSFLVSTSMPLLLVSLLVPCLLSPLLFLQATSTRRLLVLSLALPLVATVGWMVFLVSVWPEREPLFSAVTGTALAIVFFGWLIAGVAGAVCAEVVGQLVERTQTPDT